MRHGFLSGDQKELDLIKQAKNGDQRSFESLITHHSKVLYHYLRLHMGNPDDVKDVLQESVLSIWQSMSAYEYQASFKTWIFSITKRRLADFYRKNSKNNTVSLIECENTTEADDELEDSLERLDITKALSKLTKSEHELVGLVFHAQLSYQEISIVLDIPVGTVKSRMSSIRAKLKKYLQWEE